MNPQFIKQQNEERLRSLGVQVNAHLPVLESPSELSPRSAAAVAGRAFVLGYVIGIGYGQSGSALLARIQRQGISDYLSPAERNLLNQHHYTDHDKASAKWLTEAVQACAWALGLVELRSIEGCDDNLADHFMSPDVRPLERILSATLRPFEQLYSQADFNYRLHWALVQSRLNGSPMPQKEAFAQMRRRTSDWIIGVPFEWDDIPTDT